MSRATNVYDDHRLNFCVLCQEVPSLNYTILPSCRHKFCTRCITNYIEFTLATNRLSVPCPHLHCPYNINPRLFNLKPNISTRRIEDKTSKALICCPYVMCGGVYKNINQNMKYIHCGECDGKMCTVCLNCYDLFHICNNIVDTRPRCKACKVRHNPDEFYCSHCHHRLEQKVKVDGRYYGMADPSAYIEECNSLLKSVGYSILNMIPLMLI